MWLVVYLCTWSLDKLATRPRSSTFCDPGCRSSGYRDNECMSSPSCLLLQVLLYPGALAGSVGQRFEAMVKKGGPLGELVQWADLSACLTVLGHNLTFSTSQRQLHRLASPSGNPPLLFSLCKILQYNKKGGQLWSDDSCVQSDRCRPRKRQLSHPEAAHLWPYLHGLPRPRSPSRRHGTGL